jgi:protein arginine kinase
VSAAGGEASGRRRGVPVWFDSSGPDGDVVVSTRIRLARNLAEHRFPGRASAREKQKIFKEVSAVFGGASKRGCAFEVINFGQIGKLQQHLLAEERVVSVDMLRGEGDRGVAFDPSKRSCVMINEEDHLRIQGMDSGFRTFDLWELASAVDDALGKGLKYAYSERLGFLTACPTNPGTGLRVSYLMHLPGLVLTKAIDQVLQGASQMGVATRGFFGEHSDVLGIFFQLSNQATLGASEAEFIESTSGVIKEITGHERAARQRLMKEAPLEVSDKVCRAHAILCGARMLGFGELLNLTSAIRLGIECGIYREHTVDDINTFVMICMPAHLQVYISGLEDTSDEPDMVRADLARTVFTKSATGRRVRKKTA